jgi:hypothetical protein
VIITDGIHIKCIAKGICPFFEEFINDNWKEKEKFVVLLR